MNKVKFTIDIKKDYDFVNYQTDIYFKSKAKNNKQTPYSLIKQIDLINESDIEYRDLTINFEADDNIISLQPIHITSLFPGSSCKITEQITMKIDSVRLYDLKEALPINIEAILIDDNTNEVLGTSSYPLILNPLDQVMSGKVQDKLLLSCFVTPNANEVKQVIASANDYLSLARPEQNAFIGYQAHDGDSVRQEMKAIYDALVSFKIAYSNPPASFNQFQRVRLPGDVINSRRGTCIDLAVLYCACLENIGLNPLLILINNHAFAGCFLEDTQLENFSTTSVEKIRNNSSKGNYLIELVECTGFPVTSNLTFNDANIAARRAIELYTGSFDAIDIRRCHSSYYRPIPTFSKEEIKNIDIDEMAREDEELFNKAKYNKGEFISSSDDDGGKFGYWARKLLDLSLRNRLINFKFTRSNCQLCVSDVDILMGHIKDEEIKLAMSEEDIKANDFISDDSFSSSILKDEERGIYTVSITDETYKKLIRKANSMLEETGSEVLYLTLGLLKFVPNKSKVSFLAPIFLVPIKGKLRAVDGLYQITIKSEDITINTTVLEYIKQMCGVDIGIPYDIKKEDIFDQRIEILNKIRNASCNDCQLGVEENKCFISIFSFANYIMWDDIKHRKQDLLQNKVIDALVNEKLFFDEEQETSLDATPDQIACPLGADSSQIKAIIDAEKGDSFVLDGPPGTGKSQTIVNMIVNAIYHGKSVLFVAEKMAALEVVQKRIKALKLGFLCLELHSNKTNKKIMLDHLGKSIDYQKLADPQTFDETSNELLTKRHELDELINQMSRHEYGSTLYDSIIQYINLKKYDKPEFPSYDDALTLSSENKKIIESTLMDLVKVSKSKGELTSFPFHFFTLTSYDTSDIETLSSLLQTYKTNLSILEHNLVPFEEVFTSVDMTRENIERVVDIIKALNEIEIYFYGFNFNDFKSLHKEITPFVNKGIDLQEIYEKNKPFFRDDLYEENINELLDEYNSYKYYAFKRYFIKLKMKKLLNKYKVSKVSYKKDFDPLNLFNEIKRVQRLEKYILSCNLPLKSLFKNKLRTDYKTIKTNLDNTFYFLSNLSKLYPSISNDEFKVILDKTQKIYDHKEDSYLNSIYVLESSYKALLETETILKDSYGYNPYYFKDCDKSNYLPSLITMISSDLKNLSYSLPTIVVYNQLFKTLEENNFALSVIKEYRLGHIQSNEVFDSFKALYFKRLVKEYTNNDFFKKFSSIMFDASIEKYDDLIDLYSELIIKKTASNATKNYPFNDVKYRESSHIGQLYRYIKNGGRGTTIRKLLADYEDIIRTICPVFLMSPMSAAQYLSTKSKKFDIVIFDEASQIPTSEAIGAISRGNSLIVAGDPEQMPPTNFFNTNIELGEDEDATYQEDMESLLDDCLAVHMKRNRLLWHYRSQHESLIAFSNNEFYNHDLYTFPSPDNNTSRIEFKYLPKGIYEKGVNKEEAKEIVKYVKKHFENEKTQHQSLGIVTFNMKQMELLQKMISDLFEANPSFYQIDNDNEEQLFIKNLENVQGDERDVIIFSIGFGYNKDKKFNMLFGPLSLEKGERRLNVAITRARQKMIVFSSIKGNDIRTETAKNKGSTVLKNFLTYAEKGKESLIVESSHQTQPKVGIEKQLQEDLKTLNIKSDLNVGDSKFRVNLCIKNDNDEYILGIIIDGDTYINTPTCRDRNYVQRNMLNRLKWKTIRVYTYDYLRNKDLVLHDILKAIENVDQIEIDTPTNNSLSNLEFEKKQIVTYPHKVSYVPYLNKYNFNYDLIDNNWREAYKYLLLVIDHEGPIAVSLLLERFKSLYNISKAGVRAQNYFKAIIKRIMDIRYSSKEAFSIFMYPENKKEPDIVNYRVSAVDNRTVEFISATEIRNALKDILEVQGSLSIEDAARALCNCFGYEKVVKVTLDKMIKQVKYVLANSVAFSYKDNYISLIK